MPQQSPYLNFKSTYKYFSLIYLSSHRSVGSSGLQPPGLPPKTPQGLNTGAVPGEYHGVLCSGVQALFVYQEFMHLFFPPYVRILAHRRPTAEAFIPIHVRVLPDVGKLQVAMPGHPDHEERDRQQPEPHLVRQVGGIVLPSQLGIQDLYVEDSICLKSLSYAQTKALVYIRPPKHTYRYHDKIMKNIARGTTDPGY